MGKIDFITGTWLVDEEKSPISGKIQVVKSFAFGTYLQVGRLTQSGGVVYDVWRTSLGKVKKQKREEIKNCLILGLAGGSVAKLVRKYWGETVEIIGVDIDPVMVEMGKKHLGLDKHNVKIKIGDAYDFVRKSVKSKKKTKYDLICIDLYVGDQYPEKFEKDEFLQLIGNILSTDGIAVFNRLYYDEKRAQAMKFGRVLEKHFESVTPVFPQANLMFLCGN
jgi:spermidine synthase